MGQAILLPVTATETTGNPIAIASARAVTVQFTPKPAEGFTGIIVLDVAAVSNINSSLWYSIATIGVDPWFPVVTLSFSAHRSVLAFDLFFDKPYRWIRARVVETLRGSCSGYIAYQK